MSTSTFGMRRPRLWLCLVAALVWTVAIQLFIFSHVSADGLPRGRLTLVPLTWGQYGLWILWSIVTSLGPRNVVFLAKEVFPQLANTTFFFSAHTSPGVRGLVALTIDDGICRGDRSKSMLPEVLKLLRSFEAKATFFLSSHYVHGNDLPRLVFEGHEPANHMPEDKEYASSSAKSFEAALAETDDVVRPFLKASQKRWFRAPQARLTMEMAEVLQARNMTHALGDCYADDWAIPDPVRVASVYLRQVQEGSVVIMHMPQEGFRQHTYEALRLFLRGLQKRKLRAVTLSELRQRAQASEKGEWLGTLSVQSQSDLNSGYIGANP
ncbi:unnamed protein product [Durusdinium trenchii]|uniref:NodB homology domain-containing protein n=1 Tax=Durusdinium trenchii TaxID=1381693 RepID=A0ABP0T0G7_9DINO